MSARKRLYRIFYDPHARYFVLTNDILAGVTLISITALVLSTVPELAAYSTLFTAIEYISVIIFALEYGVRVYAHGGQWRRYVTSFFGLVDLLAILPTFFGFANLSFLKSARILRILQLLRMIRIAKLAHTTSGHEPGEPEELYAQRLTVHIYFFALFSTVLVFGSVMYILEPDNPLFSSIPMAMLWVTKPLLGGVAQSEPVTLYGNITVVLIRFTGLILFGLLINVIGNGTRKLLLGKD